MGKLAETLAGTVTEINANDLAGCTKILKEGPFYQNTNLISISLPSSVKEIEYDAFYDCTSLTNVSISDGLLSIGNSAFRACSKITQIILPNSVTTISGHAFENCSTLSTIEISANCSMIGDSAFYEIPTGTIKFKQPAGMQVTLPTAGSDTGAFYSKTARAFTIYTDNETIKNYAWATDNITPTFYHLDGTLWE